MLSIENFPPSVDVDNSFNFIGVRVISRIKKNIRYTASDFTSHFLKFFFFFHFSCEQFFDVPDTTRARAYNSIKKSQYFRLPFGRVHVIEAKFRHHCSMCNEMEIFYHLNAMEKKSATSSWINGEDTGNAMCPECIFMLVCVAFFFFFLKRQTIIEFIIWHLRETLCHLMHLYKTTSQRYTKLLCVQAIAILLRHCCHWI